MVGVDEALKAGSGAIPAFLPTSGKRLHRKGLRARGQTAQANLMMARFYCPATGRFLSEDPLGDGFTYVANSPINFTDPTGLAKSTEVVCEKKCFCVIVDGQKECDHCIYECKIQSEGEDPEGWTGGFDWLFRFIDTSGYGCTYSDGSSSFSIPLAAAGLALSKGLVPLAAALALTNLTVGSQVDRQTGKVFGYVGGGLGFDFGTNIKPGGPVYSVMVADPGGSTGTGGFVAAQGNFAGIARQIGGGYQGGQLGTFRERGIVTSLFGGSVIGAVVFPTGLSVPPNQACKR